MTWPVRLLLAALATYLLILAALFLLQTSILFPSHARRNAGLVPPGAIRLALEAPDGETLYGIHIPPEHRASKDRPVIMGFGGNGWNADNVATYLHDLYPELDVVAFHYRGYGPSGGQPSASGILADAPLVHDFVKRHFGMRPIVLIGFSIGTGVAAHAARHRSPAGLILVTPFDSLHAVVKDHYPWVPVGTLFRHRMETGEALRGSGVPTALIAAAHDSLVWPRRTDKLRRYVANPVLDRTVEGVGHNDIYESPAFRQAMIEAMAKMEGLG